MATQFEVVFHVDARRLLRIFLTLLRDFNLEFKQVSNDILPVFISLLQCGSERLQRAAVALVGILLLKATVIILFAELRERLFKDSPELEGRE